MLVYFTEEELEQLKAGKLLDPPSQPSNWFKVYEIEPRRELTPEDIAQAETELKCSDEELTGMEA